MARASRSPLSAESDEDTERRVAKVDAEWPKRRCVRGDRCRRYGRVGPGPTLRPVRVPLTSAGAGRGTLTRVRSGREGDLGAGGRVAVLLGDLVQLDLVVQHAEAEDPQQEADAAAARRRQARGALGLADVAGQLHPGDERPDAEGDRAEQHRAQRHAGADVTAAVELRQLVVDEEV